MTTSNRQTALVTGASAGIGKATVKTLLEAGYTVYAAARRVENMRDLEDQGAVALKMDVTNEEDLAAGVERINKEQGGVDILVNNAGFGLYGPMEDIPLDDARYQFEVNLFGLARLTQLVLTPHARAGRGEDCQRLLDRREDARPAGVLVHRHEARARRMVGLSEVRTQELWHRRRHHRARTHSYGVWSCGVRAYA